MFRALAVEGEEVDVDAGMEVEVGSSEEADVDAGIEVEPDVASAAAEPVTSATPAS